MGTPKLKLITPSTPPGTAPKLLDQLRNRIRVKHYSIRTEQAYVDWCRRFVLFHGKRHPSEMGKIEVEAFLTDLAVAGRVSASTQNQAKSAILFLYREVLQQELAWLDKVAKARESRRLPVVLTYAEVTAGLGRLKGVHGILSRLLYGNGMRLMEGMQLRVKDLGGCPRID
ncbi:MAG: phage integrase N-terminal SAM-like domain-containing protein [Methylococcales bacterium]